MKSKERTSDQTGLAADGFGANALTGRIDAGMRSDRRRGALAALLVAALALLTSWPTLRGTFVGGDDHRLVLNHVLINHPSWAHAWRLLTEIEAGRDLYQPIPQLSFAAEFAIAHRLRLFDDGLDGGAWLFHLTNTLMHAVNAVLVFALVYRLQRSVDSTRPSGEPPYCVAIAALAGAVFAIHPLQMEVIAWVNGRMMLLSIMFALASLLCLIRWLAHGKPGWAVAVVGFALLSAMSKARVELPALYVLVAWVMRARLNARFWCAWLPSTALTALIAIINRHATVEAGLFASSAEQLQGSTIARSIVALAWYLQHFAYPTGLAAWYPPPKRVDWLDGQTLGALAVVIPVIAFGLFMVRRSRAVAAGVLWFFLAIASTLPVILPRNLLAADRYMYLPVIGLAWLIGIGVIAGYRVVVQQRGPLVARCLAMPVLGIIGLVLVGVSWHVALSYNTFVDKAERIASLFPGTPHVWERLGWGYFNERRYDDAIQSARRAIDQGGAQVASGGYQIVGLSLRELGDRDGALASLKAAMDADPDSHLARYRYAILLDDVGRLDDALPLYESVLKLAPAFNPGRIRLAGVYRRLGRASDARHAYQQALTHNAYEVPALLGLVEMDMEAGDPDSLTSAEARLRQLLEWMPENTAAQISLATVLVARGNVDAAIGCYRGLLARSPGDVTALLNLAQLHLARKERAEASALLAQLERIDLRSPEQAAALAELRAQVNPSP